MSAKRASARGARRPSGHGKSSPAAVADGASPPLLVVGVGASAGGLEACQRLLQGAPTQSGLAFVVVLHLAPGEPSHVAEILQRVTAMTVTQVAGDERVERDHVYVIAPGMSLGIRDGALAAGAPDEPHFRARPIDAFFSALAADRGAGAAGIVLSGSGSDGSVGLRAIREAGGLCLVQDPATAAYDPMPRAAINTGAADKVVAAEGMGEILRRFARDPASRPGQGRVASVESPPHEPDGQAPEPQAPEKPEGAGAPPESDPETAGEAEAAASPAGLEAILDLLGTRYRVDFRDYKRGTMERRTARRIELHRLAGWQGYLDFLEAHPEEVEALYDDLLVGVTRFFRDPDEWDSSPARRCRSWSRNEATPPPSARGRRAAPRARRPTASPWSSSSTSRTSSTRRPGDAASRSRSSPRTRAPGPWRPRGGGGTLGASPITSPRAAWNGSSTPARRASRWRPTCAPP